MEQEFVFWYLGQVRRPDEAPRYRPPEAPAWLARPPRLGEPESTHSGRSTIIAAISVTGFWMKRDHRDSGDPANDEITGLQRVWS
jgi:hypothetical protein